MDDRTRQGSTSFLDDDIEFDMLPEDEPGLNEPRRGMLKPRHKGAYRPARIGRGNPNWSRIGAALFIAAVFLLIVGFGVKGFMNHRQQTAYKNYFSTVGDVAGQSDAIGKELDTLLSQPTGSDRAQLVGRLEKLEQRSERLVGDARGISMPDELAGPNDQFVLALEYRRNGLVMLRKALTAALAAKDQKVAAVSVAEANLRLAASDTIYTDSFVTSSRTVLVTEGITGVSVPESTFVSDPEFTSPREMALVLGRLKSGTSGGTTKDGVPADPNDGKVHGGQLVSVLVSPSGQTLSTVAATEVAGSENVAFEVSFMNQGEVQETQVPVTVTMKGTSAEPQEITAEIESVDPGETSSVKVPLTESPTFGEQLQVCVEVVPVPGEKTTDNNTACYQVTFKL